MLKRTEGIVLKSAIYGEADLIVTYLTREHGVVKLFAKSPRKITSRFGSSLEPLTHASVAFMGREDANLPRLTQSDILRPFHALRSDFRMLTRIAEMIDMSLRLLHEREPHPEVFEMFRDTLERLEADHGNVLYDIHFKIRLLTNTGYAPRLDVCARCGRGRLERGMVNFYGAQGSVMCSECARTVDSAVQLSQGAARFYDSLVRWPSARVDRLKPSQSVLADVQRVLDAHVAYLLAKPLRQL